MKKILLTLSTLFLTSILLADTLSCRHGRAEDGNNITCFSSEDKEIKSRLWGIDAPDLDQAFGKESAQMLSEILSRSAFITLEVFGYDTDGIPLSEITYKLYIDCPPYRLEDGTIIEPWCINKSANYQMVRGGYAWVNLSHKLNNADNSYIEEEKIAQKAKHGLWADQNPIPPWIWRKMSIQKSKKDADRILQEYRSKNP